MDRELFLIQMSCVFFIYLLVDKMVDATLSGSTEYCMDDTFTARCQTKEVIVMKSAIYGRMRIGKCVKTDLGYLGCSENVLPIFDKMCSGKVECSYDVNDLLRESVQPCDEAKPYLEASYECLPVLTGSATQCESASSLSAPGSHGYISSYVAKHTGCGSMDHPWKIEVLPGQRVNITLTSFHHAHSRSHSKCKPLGCITEVGHRNNMTICAKRGGNNHIYTSNGRHVQIYINTRRDAPQEDFTLQYNVFGCPDLKVAPFSWYKREGDFATVGCEGQDVTWNLRCEGSQWKGVVGNCTGNIGASVQQPSKWTLGDLNLQTIIIACIALGFAILLIIAGTVIALKCRENANHKPPSTILLQEEQYRMNKGPLPPIPENNSHYRSLIRQPNPQAVPPSAHSQTMPRPQPQAVQACDDYSNDYEWKFGTAPWNKPNVQIQNM